MFFSIIVPIYNVQEYLTECLNSIISQSERDFELILVDDGSKDNSGLICDKFEKNDDRVIVIHKENGGQSSARNIGLSKAKGKYVIFIDSDDWVENDRFLERIHAVIDSKGKADIIAYPYYKYFNANHKIICGKSMTTIDENEIDKIIFDLVKGDSLFCSAWSKAIRRELLIDNDIKFDESLSCEDMDWYFSVLEKTQSMVFLDEPYINYRQRQNSVTSSFNKKSVYDFLRTIKKWSTRISKMKDDIKKQGMYGELAKLYTNLLIVYSRNLEVLKDLESEIFSYQYLLKYDINPRTKKIYVCSKVIGIKNTVRLLKLVDKLKKG